MAVADTAPGAERLIARPSTLLWVALSVAGAGFILGTVYEVYWHLKASAIGDAAAMGTFGGEEITVEDCDVALDAYEQLDFEIRALELIEHQDNALGAWAREQLANLRPRRAFIKGLLDLCAQKFGSDYQVD